MRIAYDAHPLITQSQRGIGKTTRRLLEEYARRESPFDIYYYLPGDAWLHPPEWTGVTPRLLAPGESLPSAAARDGAALVHITDYFFPLYHPSELATHPERPFRLVVTARDIIPLRFPLEKRSGLARLQRYLFPLLEAADGVITISSATKADLVKHLGVSEGKIDVVHHGVDHEVFHNRYRPEEVAEAKRRYGLPYRYIVYVSAFDPRKNHVLLLNAYHRLLRLSRHRCGLVLVGPGPLPVELGQIIGKLRLRERVTILSDLPERDLALVYRGAALSAFPSLYEGFGNPLVEAMACGTPTVALARSSVPEVAADGALLVERGDDGAFARAMASVLEDPDLASDLAEKGRRRASDFTWSATARETLAVYDRVLRG